jgi:hypothetical protein
VQRFVIESFTPSCHVDNLPGAELVTPAARDTVDSILTVLRRGTGGGPRGNVQERQAQQAREKRQKRQKRQERQEQGAAATEGGLVP